MKPAIGIAMAAAGFVAGYACGSLSAGDAGPPMSPLERSPDTARWEEVETRLPSLDSLNRKVDLLLQRIPERADPDSGPPPPATTEATVEPEARVVTAVVQGLTEYNATWTRRRVLSFLRASIANYEAMEASAMDPVIREKRRSHLEWLRSHLKQAEGATSLEELDSIRRAANIPKDW